MSAKSVNGNGGFPWKRSPAAPAPFLSPPTTKQGPALKCPSIHEVICHDWRGSPSPHAWQAHTFKEARQLSYLSGIVHQRGCRWFTTPNADSWAHRLGINCTRGAQRREMSYALFSSGWNNQFLERSFVMETKHSVRRGIRGWGGGGGGGESKQLTSHKVIS